MDNLNRIELLNQVGELNELEKQKFNFLDTYFEGDTYINNKCKLFNKSNDTPFTKDISLPEDQISLLHELSYKLQKKKPEKLLVPELDKHQLLKLTVITTNNVIMKELFDIKNKLHNLEYSCSK